MSAAFFNKWEAFGWYDGVKPITKFEPMVYNFIQTWNKFDNKNWNVKNTEDSKEGRNVRASVEEKQYQEILKANEQYKKRIS